MGNVLVVDYQKDIGDMYKTIIDSVGHNCAITYEDEKALEHIKKNKFEMVLLDTSIEDTHKTREAQQIKLLADGITLIKKIKKEPNASNAKIVVITASIPPNQDANTLKKLCAKTVVMKPVKKREIIDIIAQYIN